MYKYRIVFRAKKWHGSCLTYRKAVEMDLVFTTYVCKINGS